MVFVYDAMLSYDKCQLANKRLLLKQRIEMNKYVYQVLMSYRQVALN